MAWRPTLLPWKCRTGEGWSGLGMAGRCVLLVALAMALHPLLTAATAESGSHLEERGRFQDANAQQRLSMGMYFYRVGVLNPRAALVSKTFVVQRPRLEDMLPAALVPFISLNDTANATCSSASEKLLVKTILKNFNAMNIAIDAFPERSNSTLTSSRDIKLPPWRYEPFPREYQDAGTRPGYLSMEQNLYIPFPKFHRRRETYLYDMMARAGDFARDVETISRALIEMRNLSNDIVQRMSDGFERYILRHQNLVLDTYNAASLAREFTVAVRLLIDGAISPNLIPMEQRVQMQDEVSSMVRPGDTSSGDMDFTTSVDSVSRDDANIYVTLSVEGGSKEDLFDVYSVNRLTLYLDMQEGKGSTKLIDVAPFFAVSKDGRYFIEMTQDQYRDCVGDTSHYCRHIFVTEPATSQRSCLLSLFILDKATIRDTCFYEARHSVPPTSAIEYDNGWLFLTNISNLTFIHINGSEMEMAACPQSQCVAFAPCHYRVEADHFLFPARHSHCLEREPVKRVFYPVNLAVVYHTETTLFVYFLIPPNALELNNLPVQHSDIENLRGRPTFTVVEDVVANATLPDFHQGPVLNATTPHVGSVSESTADQVVVAVCLMMLIPIFYLTWRGTRRFQELLRLKTTYHSVLLSTKDDGLDEVEWVLLGGFGVDRHAQRQNNHIYMSLSDVKAGKCGEELGARGLASRREDTLSYRIEKEADELYQVARENYLNAQRREARAKEQNVRTQDQNIQTQDQNLQTQDQNVQTQQQYLHAIHRPYAHTQGQNRQTQGQGIETHAQGSGTRGQNEQAQRLYDARDEKESQASIYMSLNNDLDRSVPSDEYASCDASTLKIR